jgi:glycosyltransferase involved in cell wall biosynthesis
VSVTIDVLIPSYNCADWIERCLESVKIQTHAANNVLLVDDASTQESYGPLALKLCGEYGYMYSRNKDNMKCPYNLRLGIHMLASEPETVIFLLDGDDFLPHENVFSRIAEVYSDPNIWLTYGNYEPYPHDTGQTPARPYPKDVIARRDFRKAGNYFNHPLTFRKHLWDHITDADLKTDRGKWFTGGYDAVIMNPMLEMSSPDHYLFLDETLYLYNAVNDLSDSKINMDKIHESDQHRKRPKKKRL